MKITNITKHLSLIIMMLLSLNAGADVSVSEGYGGAKLVSGDQFTCALFEGAVYCWGKAGPGILDVPPLQNPTQLATGRGHVCALHDGGVKCWGVGKTDSTTNLPTDESREIVHGDGHSCELLDGKVRCQGTSGWGVTDVPTLKNPTQISGGRGHLCALDEGTVRCWGNNEHGETAVPPLDHPFEISSGETHTCAINLDGVKCWGWRRYFKDEKPPLVPSQLLGRGALVPKVRLETMPRFLHKLSQDLTHMRGQFIQSIAEVLAQVEKPSALGETAWSRLLIFNLLNPFVSSLSSAALDRNLKPAYANGLQASNQVYGVNSVLEIPKTPATMTTVLGVVQSALQSLRPYAVSTSDRVAIEGILTAVEQSVSTRPIDAQDPSVRAALEQIGLHSPLLDRLRSSYKTQGITLSLDGAAEYLRRSNENN